MARIKDAPKRGSWDENADNNDDDDIDEDLTESQKGKYVCILSTEFDREKKRIHRNIISENENKLDKAKLQIFFVN